MQNVPETLRLLNRKGERTRTQLVRIKAFRLQPALAQLYVIQENNKVDFFLT